MLGLIISSLLFTLQFVVLPFGSSQFETPKIVTAEILIILLGLGTFWTSHKISRTYKVIPLVGLVLLSIYHILFARSAVSFFGNSFRMQGVFLLWLLVLFAYLSREIKIVISVTRIFLLLLLQILFAVFVSPSIDGRAVGTVGEPNALAAVMVFMWPWLVYDTNRKSFKITLLGWLIALFGILLSGSRSGLIAFGLQTLFILARDRVSLRMRTILISLALCLTLVFPLLDTNPYENRAEIWKTALIAGYEHPLLGFGVGNTEIALKAYNHKLYNRLQGYYVDSAHNLLLDWWVQGGLLGVSLIVYLIYSTGKTFVVHNNEKNISLFIGLLAVMLFNPVSIVTLVPWWWVIGQGLAASDG